MDGAPNNRQAADGKGGQKNALVLQMSGRSPQPDSTRLLPVLDGPKGEDK
jgi:hypothetical protein